MKIPPWLLNKLVRRVFLSECKNVNYAVYIPTDPVPCHESLAMPFRAEAKHLQHEYYKPPDLFSARLPGHYYYTYMHIVLNKARTIIADSDNAFHQYVPLHEQFYWKYLYAKPKQTIKGLSSIFRSAANNYYHTLIETIPRLYFLINGMPDEKVKLLVSDFLHPWEQFFLHKIVPKHITLEPIASNCIYKLDQLVFNSFLSRPFSGYLPDFYLDFFLHHFTPNRKHARKNRIYISRSKAPGQRRITNEAEIINLLEGFGFRHYVLEEISIPGQIELFYDADIVVAPHGAGLTNVIFSKQISVIELHPQPVISPHYFFLSKALGHDYHYITSTAEGPFSNFRVDTVKLMSMLNELGINKRYF